MHNKLLVLILVLILGGCSAPSLTNTNRVEVIDRPINAPSTAVQTINPPTQDTAPRFYTSYSDSQSDTAKVVAPAKQKTTDAKVADNAARTWVRPVHAKISQSYSKTHPGLSFDTQAGTAVGAIREGQVIYTSDSMVMLRHTLGFYSIYHHIKPQVTDNQSLIQSQVLGSTTDKALYVEMKKFKDLINPMPYLK